MSVNSYLTNLADSAIVRETEKQDIQRSIATLKTRLNAHFGNQISEHFVFGSYSRNTILPRSMDAQSDVDYIITFTDNDLRPQSYLDRLIRFTERNYSRTETAQSHPTVIMELNHIRFELVPAIKNWWGGLQIPGKSSNYQSWQDTDPIGFNDELTKANQTNSNLIKPLVRIIKYWNARSDHPFESYELEQIIARKSYGYFGLLSTGQINQFFYQAVDALDVGYMAPQWKKDALARLKLTVNQIRDDERAGQTYLAEAKLKQLLPQVGGLPLR